MNKVYWTNLWNTRISLHYVFPYRGFAIEGISKEEFQEEQRKMRKKEYIRFMNKPDRMNKEK